jgi:hypothetical protein
VRCSTNTVNMLRARGQVILTKMSGRIATSTDFPWTTKDESGN